MSAEGIDVASVGPAKPGQKVLKVLAMLAGGMRAGMDEAAGDSTALAASSDEHRAASGRLTVVGAPAEVDAATAGKLRAALLTAESGRDTVVVDLSRSRFCDCAGLGVLIEAHNRVRAAGGELRLLLPASGPVPRLFALTGLNQVIPAFTSLEDARRGAAAGWSYR